MGWATNGENTVFIDRHGEVGLTRRNSFRELPIVLEFLTCGTLSRFSFNPWDFRAISSLHVGIHSMPSSLIEPIAIIGIGCRHKTSDDLSSAKSGHIVDTTAIRLEVTRKAANLFCPPRRITTLRSGSCRFHPCKTPDRVVLSESE